MTRFSKWLFVLPVIFSPAILSAQDKYFDSNGVRIRYVDQGAGDPIFLIHGFTSDLDTTWVRTGVLTTLTKNHRVIALDYRGHGKSEKPHESSAYGAEMGKDVLRLMDYLKITRAHIVGYSLGSRITALLLTTNPDRFLTCTLGAFPWQRTWTVEDARAAEAEAAEFKDGIPFRSVILRTAPANAPTPTEEAIRKRSLEMVGRNDTAAMAAIRPTLQELVVSEAQMAAVRVPTLAIIGSADALLTDSQRLKVVLPDLKLVVIDGATHSNDAGKAGYARTEFVNAIQQFIANTKFDPQLGSLGIRSRS